MKPIKERRRQKAELRAVRSEAGGGSISGYAAKYGVVSEDLGGFREVLLPGCFELDPDIIFNREHNDGDPLARTSSGTLKVQADDVGLAFDAVVANTTLGRDTLTLVERRDIQGCSFAMDVFEEEWGESDDALPLRKVKRCCVYDVAAVVHPAYGDTELAARSAIAARAPKPPRSLPAARLALAERVLLPERA
jgi:HK97 family phage prohead protease